jgi:hypothetical protein
MAEVSLSSILNSMPIPLKQIVEAVFTSYLLPALIVPLVWLLGAITRRSTGTLVAGISALRFLQNAYDATAILIVLVWAAGRAGLRIEAGGRPITVLVWVLFGALNLLFATLAVRITGEYGKLPDGGPKDTVFLRFLGAIVAQPIATLAAFSLLYRLLRVVYHREFPWLDVVQEGI